MTPSDYIKPMRARRRQYACYFNTGERDADESGAAVDLIESLSGDDRIEIKVGSLRSRETGNDPPDCEAMLTDGRRLGIEVTELIDQKSLAAHCGDEESKCISPIVYTKEIFINRLQERMNAKNRSLNALKGGPYDFLILLIITDELLLTYEDVSAWLDEVSFDLPEPWDQIFLLFSYSPNFAKQPNDSMRGLPYHRIN